METRYPLPLPSVTNPGEGCLGEGNVSEADGQKARPLPLPTDHVNCVEVPIAIGDISLQVTGGKFDESEEAPSDVCEIAAAGFLTG